MDRAPTRTLEAESAVPSGRGAEMLLALGIAAIAAHGLWRGTLWGPFEPRTIEIAREQLAGNLLHSATFNGVPFLEKPVLYYDAVAVAFHLTGGPSVLAARLVTFCFAVLWAGAAVFTVRRVAGTRAGLLAGGLLATMPVFFRLCRRVQLDVALAAMLAVALLLLSRALEPREGRIRRWPWIGCLVAVGLAAWTKGVLAYFLFLTPTVAYALIVRDWRIFRALLHPVSLLLLLAPLVLWGLVLYRDGGTPFVFEHLVNNSLGRFLDIRFAPGRMVLPRGDVNEPQVWYYYLYKMPEMACIAIVPVLGAIVVAWRQGRTPASRADRLSLLALCWGLVPPLVLSFSSQKGVHHLGSCGSGLAVASGIWLKRVLPPPRGRRLPWWTRGALVATLGSAPVVVCVSAFGQPATPAGTILLFVVVGLVGVLALSGCLVARRWQSAVLVVIATTLGIFAVDFTPGSNVRQEARRSINPFVAGLARKVGDHPVGVHGAGDTDLGAITFALGRTVTELSAGDAPAFLARATPAFLVETSGNPDFPGDALVGAHPRPELLETWSNRRSRLRLFGNRAAAALLRTVDSRRGP